VEAAALALLTGISGTAFWGLARALFVLAVAGCLVAGLNSSSRWVPALCTVAAGWIGIVVGVGIGLRFAIKDPANVVTVLGLVSLSAGTSLMWIGVVACLRVRRGWRCASAITAIVGLCLIAGYAVVPGVMATNVPPTTASGADPADRGHPFQEVNFPAEDGVTLSGWYIPSKNGAAVALLPGAGTTRSSVLAHAEVLARHGYGVLAYDARGHGRSGGHAMDFGWYGDPDVSGAMSFLAARSDVDPRKVAVVGLSMGGEQAIGAAAADNRIAAVVAEGATGRVAADKSWLSEEYGVRGWLQEQMERVTYGIADLLTSAHPPITLREAVRRTAPRPVLLIAAGTVEDEAVVANRLFQASPATVGVWVVPGAAHTRGLAEQPRQWEARVSAFLDTALHRH
jgi:alpha-beta hydrolase superfamily lysophospholipase